MGFVTSSFLQYKIKLSIDNIVKSGGLDWLLTNFNLSSVITVNVCKFVS